MLVSDFDFDLPPELIAQTPIEPRDHARLMHLDRARGTISHRRFDDLPLLLRPDDLLVFNDTRVLRARLRGSKIGADGASGARVESLLLREIESNVWECLLRPSARLRAGTVLRFVPQTDDTRGVAHALATPVERTSSGGWIVRFTHIEDESGNLKHNVRDVLPLLGQVPLPPYITAQGQNDAHYQTVWARENDSSNHLESAAAPTAGLHFTRRVLAALEKRGIQTANVTLQIGIGTFRPIQTDSLDEHTMHTEHYEIPARTAELIAMQKQRGARVVAVGTTSTRVLEAAALRASNNMLPTGAGATDIFIRPGHHFKVVDALVTNFHLPRSSLLVMISAFAQDALGEESRDDLLAGARRVRYAYAQAVHERYRFFSFGDVMLLD